MILGPLLRLPRNPFLLGYFGLWSLWSARFFAKTAFKEEKTRGMFAGLAAHSTLELEDPLTASFGLVLGLTAQAVGWPLPRGGSPENRGRAGMSSEIVGRRNCDEFARREH